MGVCLSEEMIQFMSDCKNLLIKIICGIEPDEHKTLPTLLRAQDNSREGWFSMFRFDRDFEQDDLKLI